MILLFLILAFIVKSEFKSFKNSHILATPFLLISSIIIIIFFVPNSTLLFSPAGKILSMGVIAIFISWIILRSTKWSFIRKGIKFRLFYSLVAVLGGFFLFVQLLEVAVVLDQFGLDGLFQRDRLKLYLSDSSLRGGIVPTFAKVISEPFFYLYLSIIYGKGKKKRFYFIFIIYILTVLVNANTRLAVVLPIVALFLFLITTSKMNIWRVGVVASVLVLLFANYMYYANVVRAGLSEQVDRVDKEVVMETFLEELDYGKYLDNVNYHVEQVGFENGYGWFLGSVANLIPRIIWKNKPVTSVSNRFTLNFTKKSIGAMNPVITITIFGEGFLQIGYLGVFIEVFIYMLLFSYFFSYFITNRAFNSVLLGFHILTVFGIYFRAEFPWVHVFVYAFVTLTSRYEKDLSY